jgi:hypothetical protein
MAQVLATSTAVLQVTIAAQLLLFLVLGWYTMTTFSAVPHGDKSVALERAEAAEAVSVLQKEQRDSKLIATPDDGVYRRTRSSPARASSN